MEVFVLDQKYRRSEVIDDYRSFLWSERYSAIGDLELVVRASRGARSNLQVGSKFGILQSERVMVATTVDEYTDENNVDILRVTGKSLEKVLKDRTNRTVLNPSAPPLMNWELEDYPADLVRTLFDRVCRDNVSIPEDEIEGLMPGLYLPSGTMPEPNIMVKVLIPLKDLYETIKELCDVYGLGFRLVKKGDTGELYFDIYTGTDRTSFQTAVDPVIFSPELDNLSRTSELTSDEDLKNVAYVFAKNGAAVVYGENVDPTVAGFERRILIVQADNIDLPAGPELNAAIQQRGHEELALHKGVVAFDGEISMSDQYVYNQHYFLGDLVEKRNAEGAGTKVRVTEQIFASDEQGDRAYPTLANDIQIIPGTWASWNPSQEWIDAPGTWSEA